MSIALFQWCVSVWTNKLNASHWVKKAKIRVFSDMYFPYMSLDSVHIRENLALRKPLYLHILCSDQLSLLVNLGTAFFSIFHLQNSVHEALNLLHWHLPVHFLLQPQVIVYISGSVTIHLLGINIESTEFQPNSAGFKLVSGANIRFEQIKTT